MSKVRRITDKLFGGIEMSWWKVIVFAVVSAVVTAVFLIVPAFMNTSFYEMGVSYEAWVLFAIIIMTNCKKLLESALKTFVFFLISQPLIYLIQVPFAELGWQLFMYYRFWFILTLLTFPAAFVGWYLKKRTWLSLLILSPMIILLSGFGFGYAKMTVESFPSHLIGALFCFGQIVLYLYAFFDDWKKRLVGALVAVAVIAVLLITIPQVNMDVGMPLPDDVKLSDSAVAELEDSSFGEVQITDAKEGYVNIKAKKYASTVMTITDGDKTYRYDVTAYSRDGNSYLDVTPQE